MLHLTEIWARLMRKFRVEAHISDVMFVELCSSYLAKSRCYHGLTHIRCMLESLELHRAQLRDPDLLSLAIWYHDAVYIPLCNDNEEQSAGLAIKNFKKYLSPKKLKRLESLIIATKHQSTLPDFDNDTAWLHDLDLEILGQNPENYKTYSQNIRREYSLVPQVLYNTGRKKVLKIFLERPFVYATEYFRTTQEAQAKLNLFEELNSL